MELQSIRIDTQNYAIRFKDSEGAEGISTQIAVWSTDDTDEPAPVGTAFMRGDGFARVKPNADEEFTPQYYVAEMCRYTPEGGTVAFNAIRILAVPVYKQGKWSYTDRILIHPAKRPGQLKGCIAPDGWPIGKLFDALGGFRVGKQFRLSVY